MSILLGLLIMLSIGVLVTEFLGSRIIITGLRGEKKIEEKTLEEISDEEEALKKIYHKLEKIETEVEELKETEEK
jgi:hypothetical protein